MLSDAMTLARRAVIALERIADALERADPEWRRLQDVADKQEVLTHGRT